ncbi:hypothetical protein V495_05049 [Pseudogymnoascus sp. VKM F-4514 (FW-929)]|nr:hypothetical protein V495_05049 [Pseudogymnoascus sp. VKM F-4514 (FW-929)]KFY54423.1 hypothetical protein V497_07722 [Pseudogymnoascus sp. VKM F-4516 (FW-969)]
MANGSTTTVSSLSPLPPQPKLPTYQISRAPDLTLIYDPPVGSQELADALSCHYPFQKGLQQKMLQASIDFLNSEKGKITTPTPDVTPTPDATWSAYPAYKVTTPVMLHKKRPDFVASTLNTPWDIKSGKTCVKKPRGRTRGLEASERERVAKNRGNACERHRRSRTKCHQSLCVDNKLNSCDFHRESNTECTFTCLDNLLVAKGLDIGEDNIAQETSFQSANLPAYYADLELPEQTGSPQLQQFIDPKMISAQHVQDPSIWNYPPTLELDAMSRFDLEPWDESYSDQFTNRVSTSLRSCRRRDRRPLRPHVSRRRVLTWNHGEGMLDHLYRPHPFDDIPTLLGQIEQAERRFDGGSIQQGVGVPSSAGDNLDCRNDYCISRCGYLGYRNDHCISPGDNLGGASVASSLLRGYSNRADRLGYYTALSSSTTSPSPRRRSSWCERESLHHDCAYDEFRRKCGPRRGYVETLEERLRKVRVWFKTRDLSAAKSSDQLSAAKSPVQARSSFTVANTRTSSRAMLAAANADFGVNNPDIVVGNDRDHEYWGLFSLNILPLLYAFIKVWAWQAACRIHLLRLLVFNLKDSIRHPQSPIATQNG